MPAPKVKKNKFIPTRSFILLIVCMAACIGVIARLFYLQVMSYDYYQNIVVGNVEGETTVKADRGVIYDRNMIKLATNYTVYRIFVSPRDIQKLIDDKESDNSIKAFIAQGLADILALDYDSVYDNVANYPNKADRTIKRSVEEADADKVREFIDANDFEKLIHLEAGTKRYYPYGSLASHVLGFVGTDGGLLGLELKYDTYLTGVPGQYVTARDAYGQTMTTKYETYVGGQDGDNVISTIDVKLQSMLREQLKQTFEDSKPLNRVVGIVMEPSTGAILAMAVYPDFDLNNPYVLDDYSLSLLTEAGLYEGSEEYTNAYNQSLLKMWNNKAVSDTYEPGSTFKIITTAAGFEENVVSWTDEFNCTGVHVVAGVRIHCHKTWGHGVVTYARGLQQSCNPTLMMLAERIGRDKFYEYFQAFGYTEKTGIDLPGEASPIYTPFNSFNSVELAVYSFGQTFKVSPIGQLTAICTVANGGYLTTPHVVSAITDVNGETVYENSGSIRRQVVSTDICRQISSVLENGVSTDGGARNAYVAGYKIAAKTGTSEVRDQLNEEGESYLRVGSCVGFAPYDDPQIAVLIVVDQPQCENIYGSYVAAPYVANFLSEALPYIGVERNLTAEEMANLAVTLRNYVGLTVAETTGDLYNRGITYKVYGDGEKVTYQIPQGGNSINKSNGTVILYSGDAVPETTIAIPDVLGRTSYQAETELINSGLNVVIEGATNEADGSKAIVVSQVPAAGEVVEYGTVVTITMRHLSETDD